MDKDPELDTAFRVFKVSIIISGVIFVGAYLNKKYNDYITEKALNGTLEIIEGIIKSKK